MSFSSIIKHWYSKHKRDMPWRNTQDPYKIWLSEVILQQTQVAQGRPYYDKFINSYPTVFDLANATEEEVLKLWQGLGYYSRARNLHESAKHITNNLNGIFPSTYQDLLKLKGVGDYTASAIASICFNEPRAVVDGNVYRVLSRYFGIETPINSSKGVKEFKSLAQEVLDNKDPATHNQAIMEFGAKQCKPKSPNCNNCPLSSSCVALKNNLVEKLPLKTKKAKISFKHINFLVFLSNDEKTILQQRRGRGIWQNLYQFPLVETNQPASELEIISLIKDLALIKGQHFEVALYNENEIIHKLSHQHLYTKFWIINVNAINGESISFREVRDFPVPILIANFIEAFNF